MSTAISTLSSRSSLKVRTCGDLVRAVTFQSINRTSSPCWYSLKSSKSSPCPLNEVLYSPEKVCSESRLALISSRETFFMSSSISSASDIRANLICGSVKSREKNDLILGVYKDFTFQGDFCAILLG